MINPYHCYAVSFGGALIFYQLKWSALYPKLSGTVGGFLILTIAISLAAGVLFSRRIEHAESSDHITSNKVHILVTSFIYILWIAEFIHAGGIPMLKILLGQPYDYKAFGIPLLHVFIVTFSSCYTIYLFHLWLITRKRIYLCLVIVNLVAGFLIFNRGMLLFNISSCVLVWLFTIKRIPKFALLTAPILLFIGAMIFGALGTLRVSRERSDNYNNKYFLLIGQASDQFRASAFPAELFWSYIYITSPIANLEHNVRNSEPTLTFENYLRFVNDEVLMDFLSKRINKYLEHKVFEEARIPGPFNATTMYSRAYSYCGWIGIISMFILLLLLPLVYVKLVAANSPFFVTGLAILSTMFLFSGFENMIRFTGLSFQLVFPILLTFLFTRQRDVKAIAVNNKVTDV